MKQKVTVTINKEKIDQLELLLKEGKFRNKSHALEYGLQELLKESNKKGEQEA